MGMVSGIIEVVNPNSQTNSSTVPLGKQTDEANLIPSGAKGCGCGGAKQL
jgi:hypothetical protein